MSEHDNTQPERSVDKLLEDLEAEKAARSREEERLGEVLKVDEHTAAKISEERKNKVSGFKLDIDLDEEFQKTEEPAPPSVNDTEEPAPSGEPAEETAESLDEDEDNIIKHSIKQGTYDFVFLANEATSTSVLNLSLIHI